MANFVFSSIASTVSSKVNVFNKYTKIFTGEENKWKKDRVSSRLSSLTIQKSAYNEPIPLVYGRNRLAGNIIWANEIREEKTTQTHSSGGGKGSPKISQKQTTYYYYADVAIGICRGEVTSLEKIWANTDLLDLSTIDYEFYKGTETQEPNDFIESIEGIGKIPAYRGLCYIVLKNFPLAEYGNSLPNFTFEIVRNIEDEDSLENKITGVNIIPATGEFAYDTQIQYKLEGDVINGKWIENGKRTKINCNNNANKADALLSLDNLQETLPNCQWLAPVVTWFGTSMNLSECELKPKVEYKYDVEGYDLHTEPNVWKVANYTRKTAPLVEKENGKIRYGGTINDESVLRYLQEAKNRGLKIMFYPMFFIDVAGKPWRGHLSGNSNEVFSFFNKSGGYNEFILHYAQLVKDYVDVFIIGSEMIGLTKIRDENNEFPAVNELIELARQVRDIVGNNVKISYAADWSEYHHTEGGWYNLDKLWASEYIDFVGIDAYFPLTEDLKQENITKELIKEGWHSGEGWDYYYDYERKNKHPLGEAYAWKNIRWWWENEHINPNGEQTEWIPQSKKIWFTEYGFPSVDGASNSPNVFYDENSSDGGLPRNSDGRVDYFAQRQGLQATEEYWTNSNMIEQKFVWCWDARPYPYFPNNLSVWSDGGVYSYGHWLNGKMGLMLTNKLLLGIFADFELNSDLIGSIDVFESVEGLVLNNAMSAFDVIESIREVYNFDLIEIEGKLNFLSRNYRKEINIDEGDLVLLKKENENLIYLEKEIRGENELPNSLSISFIDKDFDYQAGNSSSHRDVTNSILQETISLPIVMTRYQAKYIVENMLYNAWIERDVYRFALPIKYIDICVGDLVNLQLEKEYKLRILSIEIKENYLLFSGISAENKTLKKLSDEISLRDEKIKSIAKTNLEVFEIPAINNDNLNSSIVYCSVYGENENWKGCGIYCSRNGDESYEQIGETKTSSTVGICLNKMQSNVSDYFDYESILQVKLYADDLENSEDDNFALGKNIALIGSELIFFKNAVLQNDGSYILSGFLRGLFGTEKFISNHEEGERIILINENLQSHIVNVSEISRDYLYKAVSFGDDIEQGDGVSHTIEGKNLYTIDPTHIKTQEQDNGIFISWTRVERGYGGWKNNIDLINVEREEFYEITIIKEGIELVRSIVDTRNYLLEGYWQVENLQIFIRRISEYLG